MDLWSILVLSTKRGYFAALSLFTTFWYVSYICVSWLLFTIPVANFLVHETAATVHLVAYSSRKHLHPSTLQPIISTPTAPPASSINPRQAAREIQMRHAKGAKISDRF
jgi:hypothetical protein